MTRVGRTDARGTVRTDQAAFLITDLGGVGDESTEGATVETLLSVYTDSSANETSRQVMKSVFCI